MNMPRKSTREKLSMEPILQDFSVSSLTDMNPDISPPSDSSLMMTVADYEVEVANMSSNSTLSSASYPADSTIMESIQNKPQRPLFKKPFNVKQTKKPRPSLFDIDMKDSEPDTPEQKVHRPFQRKKKGCLKASMLENESFSKSLNVSNENIDVSNGSQNLINPKKDKTKGNILFEKNSTSKNDDSFLKGRVFQRQKANHTKRTSAIFDDVFEQSSDNSLSNILPAIDKTYEHCQVEDPGKHNQKIAQPLDVFRGNTNFITRRKARQRKFMENEMFDKDILTSESDESFSSKPALKRHPVVQEIPNTTIFDNALELSNSNNLSIAKSPALKRLPFKTAKRTHIKDLPGFDSLINESLNKSENSKSISCGIFPKKFVKEHADDSINFDDLFNNTCDGSSLMSNSLTLKDKSNAKEETNLPVQKTNASVDSSQLNLNNQTGLDICNKTEEFNISNSMDQPNSGINNEMETAALFVKNIQEFSIKSVGQESHENVKETNEESNNTPTKFKVVEEDNGGLENDVEANSSQIPLSEDYDENFSSFSQDNQIVTHKENELNHSLQSNTKELTKDMLASDSRNLDCSIELSNPGLQCEAPNNKSIIKKNKMTFIVSETNNTQEIQNAQEEPNFFQVHNFNTKSDISYSSQKQHCKYDNNSDRCLKSAEENEKSLTSLSKMKKSSAKRVSFKLSKEFEERTSYSALNNTCLEGKSHSRSNQSHISNTSCSLESLVFDGSSSETTSGSIFIDLCASRNKSNIENNSYEVDNVSTKSLAVQPILAKIATSMEKEHHEETYEDSLEDLDDKPEAGLETNEKENVEIDQVDGEEGNIVLHCEEIAKSKEIENGVIEMEGDSLEAVDDNSESRLEGGMVNLVIEQLDEEGRNIIEDNEGGNIRTIEEELLVDKQTLHERTRERSIDFDKNSTITVPLPHTQNETEEYIAESENSLLSFVDEGFKKPNYLIGNINNYQFKKPGPCTVFNEETSTPPSKRKVQEMLAKLPLSEFKRKKSKPVAVDLTKEQIEQDKIDEMLRKRQTQRSVNSTKTPKLTKPKYMSSKVYDLIIEKLTPSFGIKSRVQAETVVKILNEQVDVIMKKESQIVQAVQKMKQTLANYKIIRSHWDFYKFIISYYDGYFSQKVYPSGVVSPHEPDNPFEDVCD